MESKKRQRDNTDEYNNDNKRKQIQVTTINTICSLKESISYFEDLSNEILYEIFELLDYYDVSQAFSDLNKRFKNLLIDPKFSININISSISKSNFQSYYKNIIIPYLHRIESFCTSNIFIINTILSLENNISKLIRLKTLIFNNIEGSYLNKLEYLYQLPKLSTLIIIGHDYIYDQSKIYYQIFQFPQLKYCKISLGRNDTYVTPSLTFANNKYSSIEHLVINNNIHLDLLYIILSYVPQLRRLSVPILFNFVKHKRNTNTIVLNHLTHISLRLRFIIFDDFELLVKDLFHNIQVLHISISYDMTYLDANRWENLILTSMPNLNIFDFQYSMNCDTNIQSSYNKLIENFNSSFWIDKQWFFTNQNPCGLYQNIRFFYSIKPYRRRNFLLYGIIKDKDQLDSVRHIHIKSIRAMINCMNYFPNVTQLTFSDHFDTVCDSIGNKLNSIISLKRITKLNINYARFSFKQIINLLSFTVNIHTLKLASMSLTDINPVIIQQNVTFQLVSKINIIKNIVLEEEYSLEQIELLIALCPRLQNLTINGSNFSCLSIIPIFLSNNNNNHHLFSLCLLNVHEIAKEKLRMIINDRLLNVSIEYVNGKIYLWW